MEIFPTSRRLLIHNRERHPPKLDQLLLMMCGLEPEPLASIPNKPAFSNSLTFLPRLLKLKLKSLLTRRSSQQDARLIAVNVDFWTS